MASHSLPCNWPCNELFADDNSFGMANKQEPLQIPGFQSIIPIFSRFECLLSCNALDAIINHLFLMIIVSTVAQWFNIPVYKNIH